MSGARLLPNLGAEEGPGWERMLRVPRVASAARLWEQLFGAAAQMLDGYLPPDPSADAGEVAGIKSADAGEVAGMKSADGIATAAFDWLQDLDGCIPWLGNTAAFAIADAAGLRMHGAPGEIVERVNDKAFALREAEAAGFVPRPLRGTSVVFEPELLADPRATEAAMRAAIEAWPNFARSAFTLKPRLGTSGRGRVDGRLESGRTPDLEVLGRRLPKLAAAGGAVFEPWLDRTHDLSAQLRVRDDGTVVLLGTLEQRMSRRGHLLGHCGEIDSRGRIFSGLRDDEGLREAAAAIAAAAGREGYIGPCGVDAFVFRWREDPDDSAPTSKRTAGERTAGDPAGEKGDPAGEKRDPAGEKDDPAGEWRHTLRPVVELNARFTLGTVAVGLARRHLADVRQRLGLRPGDRRAFALYLDTPRGGWATAREAAGQDAFVVPLHRDIDAVHPAILFTRSRTDLERALGGSVAAAARKRAEDPT